MNKISLSSRTIPTFCNNPRRTNQDRMATVQDLYEMEDRIIAKNKYLIEKQIKKMNEINSNIDCYNSYLIKDQNKLIGKTLEDITKLIYFRPLAGSHDYYKLAEKSSKNLTNNGLD